MKYSYLYTLIFVLIVFNLGLVGVAQGFVVFVSGGRFGWLEKWFGCGEWYVVKLGRW